MEKRSDGPSRAARRRFLKTVPAAVAAGIAGPALARQTEETQRIDKATLECGERIMGIDFSDAEQQAALSGVNTNLANFERLRGFQIPPEIEPPLTFRPYLPGKKPRAGATPNRRIRIAASAVPGPRRTSADDLAFLPVTTLSTLVRKREISSTELTRMYLARLKKHGPALNCVVTLTEDLALEQAAQADKDIGAGRHRGPLHGIPWGAKDLFATKGILTTWGAAPYQNQVFDYDATVVERLREAGAVLVAKLSLGALAQGDNWFRGQTKNPWNGRGSSGSSAGPGSATAAGLVGFSLGTETRGSIISPSAVNGVVGLRPTYGRVSRHGAMALSWTMDKIGPMCRSVEDCALVFNAIYGPDGRDDSVIDAPFEWNPDVPLSKLRIGYVKTEFEPQPADGRGAGRGGAGGRGRGGLTPEQQRAQEEAPEDHEPGARGLSESRCGDSADRRSRTRHHRCAQLHLERRSRCRIRRSHAQQGDQRSLAQHVAEHVPDQPLCPGRRIHPRATCASGSDAGDGRADVALRRLHLADWQPQPESHEPDRPPGDRPARRVPRRFAG
jgi:hypothetical protein